MKEYVVHILNDENLIEDDLNKMFDEGYILDTLETEYTKFILVYRKTLAAYEK